MPMVFSAMALPAASKITQAKSLDSRTIGEKDVRLSVAAASSAMAMSRVHTTWRATGSSMIARLRAGARISAIRSPSHVQHASQSHRYQLRRLDGARQRVDH